MDAIAQYMISKDDGKLQIPYSEYELLMEKMEEAHRIQKVKSQVLEKLRCYLDGKPSEIREAKDGQPAGSAEDEPEIKDSVAASEKVSVEFAPESRAAAQSLRQEAATERVKASAKIPPLKKDIEEHFNAKDTSGRLLNVFKQYYTCLNESCGGIVRVTMKDGILSFWNYDKWEEFAFVDIHEDVLRFSADARYTEELCSLDFCEVPRLLAGRQKFIAIQVDDLNKTMLEVLTRAFEEVGLTAG